MGYVSKWHGHGYASCFEDCFILRSQILNSFNGLFFELVLLISLCFSGLVKLGFSGLCFEWGSMVELGFSGLCFKMTWTWICFMFWRLFHYVVPNSKFLQWFIFRVGFSGRTTFQWFMFHVSFNGLCFNGLYHAFQVKTWVDLKWRVHNDLCKLNAVYLKRLPMFWRLLYQVYIALFECKKVRPNINIFLCL
jgi:hypothetical protein